MGGVNLHTRPDKKWVFLDQNDFLGHFGGLNRIQRVLKPLTTNFYAFCRKLNFWPFFLFLVKIELIIYLNFFTYFFQTIGQSFILMAEMNSAVKITQDHQFSCHSLPKLRRKCKLKNWEVIWNLCEYKNMAYILSHSIGLIFSSISTSNEMKFGSLG